MSVDIEWRPEVGKKVENFFNDAGYKDYLENAVAFNRKLNEERKMRLPYIDGQTGVAQRHYNSQRHRRERMPGAKPGQIYSYPQKHWKKKRYQYLRYFMQPRHVEREAGEISTVCQTDSQGYSGIPIGGVNEDSNASSGNLKDDLTKAEWSYYEEMFPEATEDPFNSDSDFEYEDSYSKKKTKGAGKRGGKTKTGVTKGGPGSGTPKRRANADAVPDSEKPYSCELCGIKYKTRPGLKYHIKHSHKDAPDLVPMQPVQQQQQHNANEEYLHEEIASGPPSIGPSTLTPPSTSGGSTFLDLSGSAYAGESIMHSDWLSHRQSQFNPGSAGSVANRNSRRTMGATSSFREELMPVPFSQPPPEEPPAPPPPQQLPPVAPAPAPAPSTSATPSNPKKVIGPDGKERAVSLGYCDFCLGDASENKKTHEAEELVSCAECGRSGHPTCLQFTDNMLVSVRKYPWQCIECKCCTLCGTSENDDQLLFCDDCDRGYHMYCLVPPIKEPPEGSWSCKLCIETFHTS